MGLWGSSWDASAWLCSLLLLTSLSELRSASRRSSFPHRCSLGLLSDLNHITFSNQTQRYVFFTPSLIPSRLQEAHRNHYTDQISIEIESSPAAACIFQHDFIPGFERVPWWWRASVWEEPVSVVKSQAWILILPQLFTSCVTLGKPLNFSGLQFLQL